MLTRAALYCRFSSDNQSHESIETQMMISREYCAKKGYKVVAIYADEAKTGTTVVGRDDFLRMVNDSARDIFDVVVFYNVSRNARNVRDYYNYTYELRSHGISYEYSGVSIDTSDPRGNIAEDIQVIVAAETSRKISKDTRDAKLRRAQLYQFQGGYAPFGYNVDANKHYIINDYEAIAVRKLFKMKLAGQGYKPMIDWLNEHGYRTRRGFDFVRNSLHDIFRNKIYIGTYCFRKTTKHSSREHADDYIEVPDAVPAIISADDFYYVQKKMNSDMFRYGQHKAKVNYIFSGLVRCGNCGGAFCGNSKMVNGHKYHYYQCTNQKSHGVKACECTMIRKEALETMVINSLIKTLSPMDVDKIIKRTFEIAAKNTGLADKELKAIAQEKKSLETRMGHLYDIMEIHGTDDFNLARLADTKSKIKCLEAKLANFNNMPKLNINIQKTKNLWLDFIRTIKQKDNPNSLRAVFFKIISKVEIYPERVRISLNNIANPLADSLVAPTRIELVISP